MTTENLLKKAQDEIEKGLEVCHCDRCGCMIEALNNVKKFLDSSNTDGPTTDFRDRVESYLKELKSAESS